MLLHAICRIGIFMICAQAIIHFRPRETYEKYLKLLVGVMVLIQLFLPVGSLLLGGGMEQTLKNLELFRTRLEQEMENAAREAEAADRLLEQMTLEEVRKRMEEQNSPAEETQEEAEEVPEVTVIVGPIEIQ
ncbi:MAG: stage III sporulation protein AF [Butyrivibrio sp.]|nr:stage III sporulation protein AF [Acetatifactor muris]MCM1560635.1 stage III sporulation protein AF [Butyrivibrio sp.]